MDSIDDTGLSIRDRRRAIFQRAVEKHRARGTPIDVDPIFVASISEWIEGDIEMSEVARRCSRRGRMAGSEAAPVTGRVVDVTMTSDQLLSELDRIIGMHDLSGI